MDQPIQAIKFKPKLRIVPAEDGNTCRGCDANTTGRLFTNGPKCYDLHNNVAPCFVNRPGGTDYFHYKFVGEAVSTR